MAVTHLEHPTNWVVMEGLNHNTVQRFSGSARGGGSLALSPGGRWLACGFSRGGAGIWDTTSGERVRPLSSREGVVQFSPDGRWLIFGEPSLYRLFRTSDWTELWQSERTGLALSTAFVAFSPDASMLAVPKSWQAAALLDARTGRELVALEAPDPAAITAIRWSADGKRLVFGTRENRMDV